MARNNQSNRPEVGRHFGGHTAFGSVHRLQWSADRGISPVDREHMGEALHKQQHFFVFQLFFN